MTNLEMPTIFEHGPRVCLVKNLMRSKITVAINFGSQKLKKASASRSCLNRNLLQIGSWSSSLPLLDQMVDKQMVAPKSVAMLDRFEVSCFIVAGKLNR